jgi:tetratricopeptide (TPR) repeat protein
VQSSADAVKTPVSIPWCNFFGLQMWSAFENAFLLCNKEQMADLFFDLGYICASSGEIEYAKRCFHLSLVNSNSNQDALAGLAQIAYYQGDRQKAVSLLSASLTASGKEGVSLETLYNMAVCYEELGDYGNAFQYAQMAQNIANGLGAVDKEVKDLISRLEVVIHSS